MYIPISLILNSYSAYVYVGGIPFDLTEADLLVVFAQYGEIVDVNLVRDKGTASKWRDASSGRHVEYDLKPNVFRKQERLDFLYDSGLAVGNSTSGLCLPSSAWTSAFCS